MTLSSTHRAGAALLVLGGIAGVLVPVMHPGHGAGYYAHSGTVTSHLLLFAAVLVVSLGLPALAAAGGPASRIAVPGAAAYFVGLWLLDGTHGLIDGAVLPALAAALPEAGHALASGSASQDLLAGGPLGTMTNAGILLFALGSVLLGIAIARGRMAPRFVGGILAVAWMLAPVSFIFPALRSVGVGLPYAALVLAGAALLRNRASAPSAAPPAPRASGRPVHAGAA